MKKIVSIIMCFVIVFLLTSCIDSSIRQNEKTEMFDSFNKSQNCIILTKKELVVQDAQYDLSSIKYNNKNCNIVFLEKNGFYSYTYDQQDFTVEFLFTYYEDFKTVSLGTETLPSEIINAIFCDKCFWFRVDDPETEEFKQIYYSWCVDTQQVTIVDSDEVMNTFERSVDNNRSKDYLFTYNSKFAGNYLEVTDNKTKVTKRIDESILNTFDEGKKMKKANPLMSFNIGQVFEIDDNVYFISYFEVESSGNPCYYYVVKWNFETEESEFYTSFYFENYQDEITDMYII